jgi:transposase InsO family protein
MSGGLRWGVEPICHVLEIAPSTYWSAKTPPASARAMRDAELVPQLRTLWERNYSVYGRRKLTKAARKNGIDIGRDQVARLMRSMQIRGASRSKKRVTTRADPAAVRAPDLVKRDFTATAPDVKCVADFNYCSTWSGIIYVAFVVDVYSRRIVGWKARRPTPQRRTLARARRPRTRRLRVGVLVQHRTDTQRTRRPDTQGNRGRLSSPISARSGMRKPNQRASIKPRPIHSPDHSCCMSSSRIESCFAEAEGRRGQLGATSRCLCPSPVRSVHRCLDESCVGGSVTAHAVPLGRLSGR